MLFDHENEPSLKAKLGDIAAAKPQSPNAPVHGQLRRVADILAAHADELSLAEIARELGLAKDQTFPLVKRLEREGVIKSSRVEGLQGADITIVYGLRKTGEKVTDPAPKTDTKPAEAKTPEDTLRVVGRKRSGGKYAHPGISLSTPSVTKVFDLTTKDPQSVVMLADKAGLSRAAVTYCVRILTDQNMVVQEQMPNPSGHGARYVYGYRLPRDGEDPAATNAAIDALRSTSGNHAPGPVAQAEAPKKVKEKPAPAPEPRTPKVPVDKRIRDALSKDVAKSVKEIATEARATRGHVSRLMGQLRSSGEVVSAILSWKGPFGCTPVTGYRLKTPADDKPQVTQSAPVKPAAEPRDPKTLVLNPSISLESPGTRKALEILTKKPTPMVELAALYQDIYGLSRGLLEMTMAFLRAEGYVAFQTIPWTYDTGTRQAYGYYRTDKPLPGETTPATTATTTTEDKDTDTTMTSNTMKKNVKIVRDILRKHKGLRMDDIVRESSLTFAQVKGAIAYLEKTKAVDSAISAEGSSRFKVFVMKGGELEVEDPMINKVAEAVGQRQTIEQVAKAVGLTEYTTRYHLLQLFKEGKVTRVAEDPTAPISPTNRYLYSRADGSAKPDLSVMSPNRRPPAYIDLYNPRCQAILALGNDQQRSISAIAEDANVSPSYVTDAMAFLVQEGYFIRQLYHADRLHSSTNPYMYQRTELEVKPKGKSTVISFAHAVSNDRGFPSFVGDTSMAVVKLKSLRWNKGPFTIRELIEYSGFGQSACRDALAYLVSTGFLVQSVKNPDRPNSPVNPFVWGKPDPTTAAAPKQDTSPAPKPPAPTLEGLDYVPMAEGKDATPILTYLRQHGPKSAAELAYELNSDVPTVYKAVDPLYRAKLVEIVDNDFPFAPEENKKLFKAVRG